MSAKPPKSTTCRIESLESRNLMSAGDLDPTFGVGGKVIAQDVGFDIVDVATQSDGKTVVVGTVGTNNSMFAVARLNPNGKLDLSFGGGDGVAVADFADRLGDFATAVAIQPNGKILVAGASIQGFGGDSQPFGIARFNANGTLDNTFDGNGMVTVEFKGQGLCIANAIAVQPDGRILVAGTADTREVLDTTDPEKDFAVVRLMPNGALDHTFGDANPKNVQQLTGKMQTGKTTIGFGGDNDQARVIAVAPNGKILIGGHGGPGNTPRWAIARLNSNGTLDGSFGSIAGKGRFNELYPNGGKLNDLQVQPDGSIFAVGTTQGKFAVARITSSGGLGTTFNGTGHIEVDLGGDDAARHVRVSKEGILVAGESSGKFAMVRFKQNGLLDGFFGQGGKVITTVGNDDAILTTNLTSDGKILAFGRSGSVARYISAVPKVGVYSLDRSAQEGAADHTGHFIVTRDAVYSFDTYVYFDLSGNATNGSDFLTTLTPVQESSGRNSPGIEVATPTPGLQRAYVKIPAGQSFVQVPIDVIDDVAVEGTETFTLKVAAIGNYTVDASNNTATVSVLDNDFVSQKRR